MIEREDEAGEVEREGSTHRNGTLATFWVMWLVTASSITEPIAASASHCSCVAKESGRRLSRRGLSSGAEAGSSTSAR